MENIQTLFERLTAEIQDGKSDEEVFLLLESHIGRDPELGEQAAEYLGGLSHPGAARLLLRMLEGVPSKQVRKTIRRSLYRLRGKGIAVQEISIEKGDPVFRPPKTEPSTGFASGIDSLGERFLLLALPHAGHGLNVIQAGVSDTQGLVNFVGDEMTRKGFKAFFKELAEKFPFPLIEMAPSYVASLVAQAYEVTLIKKGAPPQDYLHFKAEIEGAKKNYEKPLVYSELRTDDPGDDDRWLKRAGDLLKTDVFADWEIEREQIQPYVDAISEAEESRIVLNPAQKEARFQEIYQKALSELFSDERRRLYERRLEEMAHVLFKLGRLEEAKMSLAAAVDLKKTANVLQPNPFLFQMVIQSILKLRKDALEKKQKEPSFIVKP